jgi:uncharacterized membrane protein YsdA (DUF1294 family)
MRRSLVRWFAPLLLALTVGVGGAGAQPAGQKIEHKPPALEFTVVILATLLLLVIVCKPTRKA